MQSPIIIAHGHHQRYQRQTIQHLWRAIEPPPRLPALSGEKNAKTRSLKTAPALAVFSNVTQLQKTQKNAIAIIQRSRDQLKKLGMFL